MHPDPVYSDRLTLTYTEVPREDLFHEEIPKNTYCLMQTFPTKFFVNIETAREIYLNDTLYETEVVPELQSSDSDGVACGICGINSETVHTFFLTETEVTAIPLHKSCINKLADRCETVLSQHPQRILTNKI